MARVIPFTSFDGLALKAFSYGPEDAAHTVLCLHGLTRNHKDFEPMIEALDLDCRFVGLDVRGRGESQYDPKPMNYIPPVYVRDVLTLLDILQTRVVLIGTSMGGLMSMLLAPLIPDRIIGIVMNDIGPEVRPSGLRRIGKYVGRSQAMADWQAAAASVKMFNEAVFPAYDDDDWMAFARRTCREREDGTVIMDYDPHIADSFVSAAPPPTAQYLAWRMFSGLKKFPLLLIRGETSDLLSDRVARRMLRRHTKARLVEVPGIGHAPLLNEPVVIASLRPFLLNLFAAEQEDTHVRRA